MKLIDFFKRKFRREERTYELLKFQYKPYYKITKAIQQRSVKHHNEYLRNFNRSHKRNPNRKELGRIVRGCTHITIYKTGNRRHWQRQRVRQYLYGLHKISYVKR